MLSFTGLRSLAGKLVNDTASATADLLVDSLYNDEYKRVAAMSPWDFLQRTRTATTTAGTQFYDLPADVDMIVNVTVTNGTLVYTPRPVQSRTEWDQLNYSTAYSSNYPQFYFVFNGQLGFWPKPSQTSNTITYSYRKRVPDLSLADYATGNVSAVTSGAAAVTGTGTTWTVPMATRFLKITPTSTAAASGDGLWYEISSVGSTTALTLVDSYLGTTISASTAFTIGQMPLLPEAYHTLPLWRSLDIYYSSVQPESDRALLYRQKWEQSLEQLQAAYGKKTTNVVLDGGDWPLLNPNLFLEDAG